MKNPDSEKAEGEGKVVGYQLVKALPSLAQTREDPPPPISSSVASTLFLAFVGFYFSDPPPMGSFFYEFSDCREIWVEKS